MSLLSLKAIDRDMAIFSIPGTAGKRSLIRAILASPSIAREAKESAKTELNRAALPQTAVKPARKTHKKSAQTAQSEPLGQQLSLNLSIAS